MTGGVLGGGVIFVVAALLWAAVLVPAWYRRREFRAAEQNAMRLQRTLRVLAETAEMPQEIRLEATAKQALAQEKLLRTAQRQQAAERDAELAEAKVSQVRAEIRAQQMKRKQIAAVRAAKLKRPAMRRMRAISALGGLIGALGILVGIGFAVAGNPALLVWSLCIFLASAGALVLLAPGRARMRAIPAERLDAAPEVAVVAEPVAEEQPEVAEEFDTGAEQHLAQQREAAARIDRARALARARASQPAQRENHTDSMLLREVREQVARARASELRAEQAGADASAARTAQAAGQQASAVQEAASENTPPMVPRRSSVPGERAAARNAAQAQRSAAAERLRGMGVIGDTSEGMPDLDAALRRRRNVS